MPAITALALLGAVVAAGASGGLDKEEGRARVTPPSSPDLSARRTSLPTPRRLDTPVATTTPVTDTAVTRTLSFGMVGDDVRALQQRLKAVGFDPGPIDGSFGELTRAAVWGFEKLAQRVPRDQASGVVTSDMWERMQQPLAIRPRRPDAPSRNHTEIYLPEQVLIVFHDDVPVFMSHISSGDGQEWCDEVTISPGEYGNEAGTEPLKRGECGVSTTPGGVYEYHRQVKGVRQSALGALLNPVYFNYGIAVHGAYNVPLQPVSHGCVRIPNAVSAHFQDSVTLGESVYVWDGVKEPEAYGAQPPRFNWLDPNYPTTTTTAAAPTTPAAPPVTIAPTPATSDPVSTADPTPETTSSTAPPTTPIVSPTTTTPPTTTRPPTTTPTSTTTGV